MQDTPQTSNTSPAGSRGSPSGSRGAVALYVTCLADLLRPSVAFAALQLLEDAGYDVVVPEGQTCCGQPGYNSGDRDGGRKRRARRAARKKAADAALASASATHFIAGVVADAIDDTNATDTDAGDDDDDESQSQSLFGRFM